MKKHKYTVQNDQPTSSEQVLIVEGTQEAINNIKLHDVLFFESGGMHSRIENYEVLSKTTAAVTVRGILIVETKKGKILQTMFL